MIEKDGKCVGSGCLTIEDIAYDLYMGTDDHHDAVTKRIGQIDNVLIDPKIR